MHRFEILLYEWKAWKKSGWIKKFLGMGNHWPDAEELNEFNNSDTARSVQMSDKDLIDKAKGNYNSRFNSNGGNTKSNLFPVKVYDKHGVLIKTISVEELKEHNNVNFKKRGNWMSQVKHKKKSSPVNLEDIVKEIEKEERGNE